MGVLLGIAGGSFGIALSLGAGWFPQQYKGLAMGIAGAGNSGTAFAALFAPKLAMHFGWQHVYGFAACCMLLPLFVMIFFAKEPPDVEHQSLGQHLACLWQADGWYFNMVYVITFGGFIGLSTFLTTFYVSQFHMTKVHAGFYTVLATFTGSATRVLGGYFADKVGGISTLSVIFLKALLQQSGPGRDVRVVALPQTSSRLDVQPFTEDCDGLRERTDTDAEGAFDNARLAADVVGEVEERRLTLA